MISAKEAKLQTDKIDESLVVYNKIIKEIESEIKEAIDCKMYEAWYHGKITKSVAEYLDSKGFDVYEDVSDYFGYSYRISWENPHDVKE